MGVSRFNLNDLLKLGASAARSAVLPIVVEERTALQHDEDTVGHWAFVGRIAPNKGQIDLVELFARVRKRNPQLAKTLTLVGGSDPNEGYVERLKVAVSQTDCGDCIHILGKITDEERDRILAGSDFYVSLSEHEGFGVPLIEAPLAGLPALALDRAAVGETMGGVGAYPDLKKLEKALIELSRDRAKRADLLKSQQENARKYSRSMVSRRLFEALQPVVPAKDSFTSVSVVICTYNRKDYLERCLDYLTYQSNDNFEVIVVDGPSDDGTAEVLARHRGCIKVVKNPDRNLSKSRNLGIDAAAGDIVAFIDDDALPFDDWVDRVLQEYNGRTLTTAGLGGPAYYAGSLWFQAEDNGISNDCQVKVSIDSREIGRNGWYRYNTGTNATFAREALVQVDGFDEQYDYFLDESELCLRLQKSGWLIGYAPEVIVRHEFAKSHNRSGKFNYNWFTICKNSAYFVATNGGLKGKKLEDFLTKRFEVERVAPLDKAVRDGELSSADRDRHVQAIWDGMAKGLSDAAHWPRTRAIKERPSDFLCYATRRDRPAVLRDCAPLHICIVSKELPPFTGSGGVGTLYYHLASELLLMGHHVSAIVPGGEDRLHRQGRLSIYFTTQRTFSLPVNDNGFSGNVDWSLSALAKLSAIHRERPIDIVDSALWDAETLAFSLLEDRPPLVVRLVTPFSVSASINGWNPSPVQQDYFMEGERTLVQRADAVIPISRTIAATVMKTHGVNQDARWSTGHCGIAPWPFFDVNAGYDDFPELELLGSAQLKSAQIVLFIGRLERRKGIDMILEAAPKILAGNPTAVLVFGGRDPDDWESRFREALPRQLQQGSFFLARFRMARARSCSPTLSAYYFRRATSFFGLVPLEAFVHGCPVVATRAGAIPEVVQDGVSGILVEPEDSAALAKAVGRILADEELRGSLSDGARRRVNDLSARNSAVHTVSVYQRLVHRRAFAAATTLNA